MAYNKYAAFYAAYNASVKRGNSNSKEEMIQQFTNCRTSSIKDLNDAELKEIVAVLNAISGVKPVVKDEKADRMRKAIISIFKKMNRPTKDAIAWAEKQGVRGEKKDFNDYSTGELYVLINVAEKVLADWQQALRKKIATI
jgi:hypothetical protein